MVKTNDLKEMLFKVGLYNVSKLDDFDFKFSDHKEYLMHILRLEYEARTKHSLEDRIKRSKLPKVDTSKKYSGIDEWNMKELLKRYEQLGFKVTEIDTLDGYVIKDRTIKF